MEPTQANLQQKIKHLLASLDASFLERRQHTRLALLCLLSGQHMLMIGPPGTAKSLLARAICQSIQGADYFEYLLSRFTHPDELFGPVSIPGLKQEDYRRITRGYLPQAHVVFLDEIFKANSAILNSLLTVINERVFHHGVHRDRVPLLGMIGASNETPEPGGPLEALHDRFLVRMSVMPLHSSQAFLQVSLGQLPSFQVQPEHQLTQADLALVRRASADVQAPEPVRQALVRLRQTFQDEQIEGSDRRWRQAVGLLKVAAWTSGRQALSHVDLLLLQHCFGTPCETDVTVGRLVREVVQPQEEALGTLQPLRDLWDALAQPPDRGHSLEQARQGRLQQIEHLLGQAQEAGEHLDGQRDAMMRDFEDSLWEPELPPEAMASFIAARRQLQNLKEAAQSYRQSLEDFRLDERFLEELTQNSRPRRRARNFYEDEDEPVLWVSSQGAPPEQWHPLLMNGSLGADASLREAFQDKVNRWLRNQNRAGEPWHAHVLRAELDNDLLFTWRRAPEFNWSQRVGQWFDELWRQHNDPASRRRPPGWDQETTRGRFTQLIERLRWIRLEVFPEAPKLTEATP
jgi:MoxR-like ATPase